MLYLELTDRFFYNPERLEKIGDDGLSTAPMCINFYTIDSVMRYKYVGPKRDVYLILFKYKYDNEYSYAMRFGSQYLCDSYFNKLRRKLMRRRSPIKRI
jgi:hypothetical protein